MVVGKMTFVCSILATASLAQDQPAFRSTAHLVTLPVAVVDSTGAPVRDLRREDFRVFDNGIERRIEHFWTEDEQPLTLGIIADLSTSQSTRRAEHLRIVGAIAEQLLRPTDHIFVIAVQEEVRLWSGNTNSVAELQKSLTHSPGDLFGDQCPKSKPAWPGLKPVSECGESPLWNAVYAAAMLKLNGVKGKKAVLLLTDGFDTGSNRSPNDARDQIHKADAAVYAIQYPGGFGGKFVPDLIQLVRETGGIRFHALSDSPESIIHRLKADLFQRYVLAFRPERLNVGKLRHEVRIDVARADLSVRARRVYFAEFP